MKSAVALLAITASVGFAGCQFSITPDGPSYAYAESNGTVTVTAPPDAGNNQREFFWDGAAPEEGDTTVCATFSGGQDNDQPGIAMRIADDGDQAVTVTQNIYGDDRQAFNFHTWNTANGPDNTFTPFGQTILPVIPMTGAWPLSMCARIVDDTVQFVVWTSGNQPDWGDPIWGGQATLPADAPSVGQSGFYVGHLEDGTSMMYANLTVDSQATDPLSLAT